MKKLLLLIIIPFLSFGQDLTYVPDDGFEYWIENNIDGASNGDVNDNYVLTAPLQSWGWSLSIEQTIPIYDLMGIEDFMFSSLTIDGLYVSEIDLSDVEFSAQNQLTYLNISGNQYLENIILPKDTIHNLIVGYHLGLENIEFQDELVFSDVSISYCQAISCEINFKGKAINRGELTPTISFTGGCFEEGAFGANPSLVSIDFSLLSEIPFGTRLSFGSAPSLSYININNDIPIYNWELDSYLLSGENLCIEVNNPDFCYNNTDWPQEFFDGSEWENINYTTNCNTPDCSTISILNTPTITKSLLKTIDILGREATNKGFQLHIYNDGSVEKKYVIK